MAGTFTFILTQSFGKFLIGYYAGRKRCLLQDAPAISICIES